MLRVRSAYEMCAMRNADKKLMRPNYEHRVICIDLEHDFVCAFHTAPKLAHNIGIQIVSILSFRVSICPFTDYIDEQ